MDVMLGGCGLAVCGHRTGDKCAQRDDFQNLSNHFSIVPQFCLHRVGIFYSDTTAFRKR
jgi:hypothetical protein